MTAWTITWEALVSSDRPWAGVPCDAVVKRLLGRDEAGRVSTADVKLAAAGVGVSPRTLRRWLAAARAEGRFTRESGRGSR